MPIDLIEIRPGIGPSGYDPAHAARRGMADRPEDVPHFQRRLLSRLQPVQHPNLGASLEFRFSREWRLQSAVEPTSSAAAAAACARSLAPAATSSAPTSFGNGSSDVDRALLITNPAAARTRPGR